MHLFQLSKIPFNILATCLFNLALFLSSKEKRPAYCLIIWLTNTFCFLCNTLCDFYCLHLQLAQLVVPHEISRFVMVLQSKIAELCMNDSSLMHAFRKSTTKLHFLDPFLANFANIVSQGKVCFSQISRKSLKYSHASNDQYFV